ncbi:hypothetical protein BH20ACI4_BH20ACI4_11940 [soil metagenome]
MTPLPIIESFSIVAPLGVCFHDTATGDRVLGGLEVFAYPSSAGVWKNKTALRPNRQGVYVLQKIKGLGDFSSGNGDAEFWKENPPEKNYIVEVSDIEGRFQAFQFTVKLPVRGIYEWENIPLSSPNRVLKSIPLYSAPPRKISGGAAVVRAQLKESSGVPAALAVLEARFEGTLVARGIADRDGQTVLIFPSLAPQTNPIVSPPATSTRISLAEQNWNLDLTVKYQPNIFQTSPSEIIEDDEEKLPDLRLVLAQAEGTLWADGGQTEEYTTAVLQTGRELVLRSRPNANTSPMPDTETVSSSFLFVSPAI